MTRPIHVAVVGLLMGCAIAAPSSTAADPPPVYFATKLGTTWVYQFPKETVTVVVTDVETKNGTSTVALTRADGEFIPWEVVTVSEAGVSVHSDGPFRHDPPVCWLKAPFKAGDSWKFDTWLINPPASDLPYVGTVTVKGVEKVEVPAGTFQAVRVQGRGTDLGKWTEERWYAPEVGLVKWVNRAGQVVVLKSFMPGRK